MSVLSIKVRGLFQSYKQEKITSEELKALLCLAISNHAKDTDIEHIACSCVEEFKVGDTLICKKSSDGFTSNTAYEIQEIDTDFLDGETPLIGMQNDRGKLVFFSRNLISKTGRFI